jgi:hypothetical protein
VRPHRRGPEKSSTPGNPQNTKEQAESFSARSPQTEVDAKLELRLIDNNDSGTHFHFLRSLLQLPIPNIDKYNDKIS